MSQLPLRRTATCSRLRVPLTPGARQFIEIGIIRLASNERANLPPVLLLPGGPGDSFSPHLESRLPYLLPFASRRDLLIVDQRGTGTSIPVLDCDKKLRSKSDLGRCYAEWNKDLDVAAFSTRNSAADLLEVLDALEIGRVSIVAVSYGTRLATEFVERNPERVEGVVLDSPLPRTVDVLSHVGSAKAASLERVISACEADGRCAPALTSSVGDLLGTLERLGPGSTDAPSAHAFLTDLSQLSISPAVLPLIPLLIDRAGRGDFSLFDHLRAGFSEYQFAFGLHLSVQCAEVFPLHSPEQGSKDPSTLGRLGSELAAAPYGEFCGAWRVPTISAAREEAKFDVPTLIMHGAYDPITPLSYAEKVRETLEHARLVVIPDVSHGAAFSSCGTLVVQQFLESPGEKQPPPLPPCATRAPSIQFAIEPPTEDELGPVLDEIRHRL